MWQKSKRKPQSLGCKSRKVRAAGAFVALGTLWCLRPGAWSSWVVPLQQGGWRQSLGCEGWEPCLRPTQSRIPQRAAPSMPVLALSPESRG